MHNLYRVFLQGTDSEKPLCKGPCEWVSTTEIHGGRKAFGVCRVGAVGPSHRIAWPGAGGSRGAPSAIHSNNILLSLSLGVGTRCKARCSSIQVLYLGYSEV